MTLVFISLARKSGCKSNKSKAVGENGPHGGGGLAIADIWLPTATNAVHMAQSCGMGLVREVRRQEEPVLSQCRRPFQPILPQRPLTQFQVDSSGMGQSGSPVLPQKRKFQLL